MNVSNFVRIMMLACCALPAIAAQAGERLYNGIELPDVWPPRTGVHAPLAPLAVGKKAETSPAPETPPYLVNRPAVVPIDVGRQLFVDDFLIESTTLVRTWHKPVKYVGNPVLKPERPWELGGGVVPMAAPFSDGCFYDPRTKKFMLWYSAGWFDRTALATSDDGIHWERPNLDVVPGTNVVLPVGEPNWRRDTVSIWLDHDAPRDDERFKATMFCRTGPFGEKLDNHHPGLILLSSADGVHWIVRGRTTQSKDNTTIFYNPFRKRWVVSHRIHVQDDAKNFERARAYWETKDLFSIGERTFVDDPPVVWAMSDSRDEPDKNLVALQGTAPTTSGAVQPAIELGNAVRPQIYKIDATPYESVMLGLFEILSGPTNDDCAKEGKPKTTDLQIAFSRDGFHWDRAHREPFIACSRKPGDWERGYISSCGGGCLVVGDELWFYYGAFAGDPTNLNPYYVWGGIYANGATGLAKLRRDGFASLDAGSEPGTLTTRPVTFSGTVPFVNVDATGGELRCEVLDVDGRPIAPLTLANSEPITTDGTCVRLAWRGAGDLASLGGKPVRFRFKLTRGKLYAFWVSNDESGASGGYVAAGGPDFTSARDTVGAAKSPASSRTVR